MIRSCVSAVSASSPETIALSGTRLKSRSILKTTASGGA
jgi:hypothetical protein